ncbi:MAG TPA: hypothetical protein VFU23_11555 [Gemmatimonadales bacterium]|nr:hypothetical protein [Gemmatimonadales bacterium]
MRRPVSSRFAFVLAGVAAIACGKTEKPAEQAAQPPAPPPPPNVVHIEATEYAFKAPDTIPSGVTTFHMMNGGKEIHHVVIMKATADELKKMNPEGPVQADLVILGGPNAAPPGGTAEATVDMPAGTYTIVCLIPGADGKLHMLKGMSHQITVTQGTSTAVMPTPDVTLKLSDYAFDLSTPLTAGHHVIRIENAGPQVHELVFIKLEPGKTMEDFGKWALTLKGPPPGMPINGGAPMSVGGVNTVAVDLTPGDYGMICFVSDSKDKKPHYMHGMVKTVTVT